MRLSRLQRLIVIAALVAMALFSNGASLGAMFTPTAVLCVLIVAVGLEWMATQRRR